MMDIPELQDEESGLLLHLVARHRWGHRTSCEGVLSVPADEKQPTTITIAAMGISTTSVGESAVQYANMWTMCAFGLHPLSWMGTIVLRMTLTTLSYQLPFHRLLHLLEIYPWSDLHHNLQTYHLPLCQYTFDLCCNDKQFFLLLTN